MRSINYNSSKLNLICIQSRVASLLFLAAALPGQKQNNSANEPQYFDPPAFIVAGVADYSARGGHGSDPVLRSAEGLAAATVSLTSGMQSKAEAAEKSGDALAALREYQRAAEREPTESHLFDLGAELLKHRAAEQAAEVFGRGARLFPRSSRMLLGGAVALYSRGSYQQARILFFQAADLNPADPTPYLFLGKVQSGEITQSEGFAERMARFAKLHPENAWANYFYAVSLWKRSGGSADAAVARSKAQSLLEKAIRIDPKLSLAWLQLGIVHADAGDDRKAVSAWKSALVSDPQMEEAHYRLAHAYRRTGQPEKAKEELDLYERLSRQKAADLERERAEIKQFVFTLQDRTQ